MSMRNVLLSGAIALSALAMPAVADLNIIIGVAPPIPRIEVVPAPRVGYAWAPGYWRWEGQRHVWATGHWIQARPGSQWVPDRWEPRDGRHHYAPGRWETVSKEDHGNKGNGKGKGWAKGHDR